MNIKKESKSRKINITQAQNLLGANEKKNNFCWNTISNCWDTIQCWFVPH